MVFNFFFFWGKDFKEKEKEFLTEQFHKKLSLKNDNKRAGVLCNAFSGSYCQAIFVQSFGSLVTKAVQSFLLDKCQSIIQIKYLLISIFENVQGKNNC